MWRIIENGKQAKILDGGNMTAETIAAALLAREATDFEIQVQSFEVVKTDGKGDAKEKWTTVISYRDAP